MSSSVVSDRSVSLTAGSFVWWDISSETDPGVLQSSLPPGMEFKPGFPSPKESLLAACRLVYRDTDQLKESQKGAPCLAITKRTWKNDVPQHDSQFTLCVTDGYAVYPKVGFPPGQDLGTIQGHVRRLAGRHQAVDISMELVKLVTKELDGIVVRPSGGVYFVPDHSVAKLKQVADAIIVAGCGETKTSIVVADATYDDRTIDSLRDRAVAEFKGEAASMLSEIIEGASSDRCLENRGAKCVTLAEKVRRYERTLQATLTDVWVVLDALASVTKVTDAIKLSSDIGMGDELADAFA